MRDTCISASVTRKGRELLTVATTTVESHFTKANGFVADARVIYGDTDSIMVNFGEVDLKKTFALCAIAEVILQAAFKKVPPINMPLEKVFVTYLLRSKKRYAGWKHEKPDDAGQMTIKGMENVRRSTCREVRIILDQILVHLIRDADVDRAFAYAKYEVIRLLEGKVDLHGLVMTASLSKNEYVTPPAIHKMKERMEREKRDRSTIPIVGNRVSYLYTVGNIHGAAQSRSSLGDMIEIPEYVFENDIPINYDAYLIKQYINPLCGIFMEVDDRPVVSAKNGRMMGLIREACIEATRPTHVSSVENKIGTFLSYRPSCVNCKQTLPNAPFIPYGRPPSERAARFKKLCEDQTRDIEDLYYGKREDRAMIETKAAKVNGGISVKLEAIAYDDDEKKKKKKTVTSEAADEEDHKGQSSNIKSTDELQRLCQTNVSAQLAILHSELKDGALNRVLFPEHYPQITALCDSCKHTQMQHYVETVNEVSRLEEVQHKCWSYCQRCVHSHFGPDRCNNNDCAIYYRRKTTHKELTKNKYLLERIACE